MMKKILFVIIPIIAVICGISVGIISGLVINNKKTEPVVETTAASVQSQASLSEDDVLEIFRNACAEYEKWSHSSPEFESRLILDNCIYEDDPLFGEVPYYRVNDRKFTSVLSLKKHLTEYFDENICDEILSGYIEKNGTLYACMGNAFGMTYRYSDLSVTDSEDGCADFDVRCVDETGASESFSYRIINKNGKYVFTGKFICVIIEQE